MRVKKLRVYRVEHQESKRGPYTHQGNCEKYGIDGCSSRNRPMPYNDGICVSIDGHRFGFKDTKKLARWFSKEDKENLAKAGFVCRVYEVPEKHVRFGKKQLTFDHAKAKVIRQSRAIPKCATSGSSPTPTSTTPTS